MRVLLVGPAGHSTLVPVLEATGATVAVTPDAGDAAARASEGAFDCVLVSDTLGDPAALLRRLDGDTPVVFVSSGDAAALNAASAAGVDAVVATEAGTDDAAAAVERLVDDTRFDASADRVQRLRGLVERAGSEDASAEEVCGWLADEYGAAWLAELTEDALRPTTGVGVSASVLADHPRPSGLDGAGRVAVADGTTVLRLGDERALCVGTERSPGERRALAALARTLASGAGGGADAEAAVTTLAGALGHELNNHLQTVRTYLDLAVETGDTEHVETARDLLPRVDRVADDAAALADPDALDREETSVADAAAAAWERERTNAPDASLSIDADLTVSADPGLLELLFENLLRNCVEHGSTPPQTRSEDAVEHGDSDEDGVAITVGVLPDDAGFYVEDDGPGIPESDRERVFEWGYTTGGSGIGLPLVQRVADRHGWTVSVTDGEDGGARFEVSSTGR